MHLGTKLHSTPSLFFGKGFIKIPNRNINRSMKRWCDIIVNAIKYILSSARILHRCFRARHGFSAFIVCYRQKHSQIVWSSWQCWITTSWKLTHLASSADWYVFSPHLVQHQHLHGAWGRKINCVPLARNLHPKSGFWWGASVFPLWSYCTSSKTSVLTFIQPGMRTAPFLNNTGIFVILKAE